jgi:hypothetical protein
MENAEVEFLGVIGVKYLCLVGVKCMEDAKIELSEGIGGNCTRTIGVRFWSAECESMENAEVEFPGVIGVEYLCVVGVKCMEDSEVEFLGVIGVKCTWTIGVRFWSAEDESMENAEVEFSEGIGVEYLCLVGVKCMEDAKIEFSEGIGVKCTWIIWVRFWSAEGESMENAEVEFLGVIGVEYLWVVGVKCMEDAEAKLREVVGVKCIWVVGVESPGIVEVRRPVNTEGKPLESVGVRYLMAFGVKMDAEESPPASLPDWHRRPRMTGVLIIDCDILLKFHSSYYKK